MIYSIFLIFKYLMVWEVGFEPSHHFLFSFYLGPDQSKLKINLQP